MPLIKKHSMNQYFWDKFESLDQSVCANLDLSGLPLDPARFIFETVGTTEALLGLGCVESVILFGSLAYDHFSEISDVDLLIVVSDYIDYKNIRRIEGVLKSIEIKYGYAEFPKTLIKNVLRSVERSTGMFCSHFVCRKESWLSDKFSRIFNTFPPFTWLLAPSKIVLNSMKSGARLLYGNIPINERKKPYPKSEVFKSVLMNFALYCGGLTMLPFGRKHMAYVMESFKWSLRTAYFLLFQKTGKLEDAYSIATKMGLSKPIVKRFRQLRRDLQLDLKFALRLPFYIVHLHMLLVRYI